ncbi:hypothetical protein MPL1_06457 [Methylophaga lonarensis MPL]|uniref:Cytochrome c domain-containing protein n=1 Tax=Methylophaga lonarensis MPL TaxID=1286106 RepID=M7PRQ3_9GAMM|nr:cytochrome c [Methylophaga lonarensis]EMR13124.1 hypothetical protein MPL1_06457 [Methylophaga lonarensis MPL]
MRLLTLLVMLCVSPLVLAQGKQLHDSSCVQCHSSLTGGKPDLMYTKADRKIGSFEALEKRVGYCAVAAGVSWSPDQVRAVTDYLNRQFYRF